MDDLENQLQRASAVAQTRGNNGGILVISEGVFSMSGNRGKLKDIVALKSKYGFRLLIDDAHGFGVFGDRGNGCGADLGLQNEIDLYFSTFTKSMASIGAFIAGEKKTIDYLRYNTRSQIFSRSLPLIYTASNIKRLEILENATSLRNNLWKNVHLLHGGLKEKGFDIGVTASPITPIYLKGSIPEATHMLMDLRENHDVFCSIVVPPVIPQGQIIYRLIPTAIHTEQDISLTLNAFEAVREKLIGGAYKKSSIPNKRR